LQAGGHRFDPGQLHQIAKELIFRKQAGNKNLLPNAGRQTDTVIILNFGNPQRRFGADHWTGQASNNYSAPS
jgi:hypothetical protein